MSSVEKMIFFQQPSAIYVNKDYSVKPAAYQTIDKLMQSLLEKGPLAAVGKIGPAAYTEVPFKVRDKVGNKEVYGWKPLTFKEHASSTLVFLLGAKKTKSNAYIYFTLAKDATEGESSLRSLLPLDTDAKKVYVMSYRNFLNRSVLALDPNLVNNQNEK